MTEINLEGRGVATITLDIPSLLNQAGMITGVDHEGDPILEAGFRDEIHGVILSAVTKEFLRDREVRSQIGAAVATQVAEVLAATLDQSFQPMNQWGERDGSPMTLREKLVKDAAEQVRSWMGKSSGYRSNDNDYATFLKRTVDQAVTADLNGELKAAREGIRERVKAFAAEKLTADAIR